MLLKVHDWVSLCECYGYDCTLGKMLEKVRAGRIHKCPKCKGFGILYENKPVYEYGEFSGYRTEKTDCDLCNGEGYTDVEYRPKMVQDGWEEVK